MTQQELKQIYFLDRDKRRCEMVIQELRASIQAKSQKLTGMPFQNTGETSDPTADMVEKIAHYEYLLSGYIEMIAFKKAKLTEEINKIEDPMLRNIIHYRCIDLLPWEVVSIRIGAGTTEDSVKKMFYRAFPKE